MQVFHDILATIFVHFGSIRGDTLAGRGLQKTPIGNLANSKLSECLPRKPQEAQRRFRAAPKEAQESARALRRAPESSKRASESSRTTPESTGEPDSPGGGWLVVFFLLFYPAMASIKERAHHPAADESNYSSACGVAMIVVH